MYIYIYINIYVHPYKCEGYRMAQAPHVKTHKAPVKREKIKVKRECK